MLGRTFRKLSTSLTRLHSTTSSDPDPGPSGEKRNERICELPNDVWKLIVQMIVEEFWRSEVDLKEGESVQQRQRRFPRILPLLLVSRSLSSLTIPILYDHIEFFTRESYISFLQNSHPSSIKHIQRITVRTHLGEPKDFRQEGITLKEWWQKEDDIQGGEYRIAIEERNWRFRLEEFVRKGDGLGTGTALASASVSVSMKEGREQVKEGKKEESGMMGIFRWKQTKKVSLPAITPYTVNLVQSGIVRRRIEIVGERQRIHRPERYSGNVVPTFDCVFRPSKIILRDNTRLATFDYHNTPADHDIPVIQCTLEDLHNHQTNHMITNYSTNHPHSLTQKIKVLAIDKPEAIRKPRLQLVECIVQCPPLDIHESEGSKDCHCFPGEGSYLDRMTLHAEHIWIQLNRNQREYRQRLKYEQMPHLFCVNEVEDEEEEGAEERMRIQLQADENGEIGEKKNKMRERTMHEMIELACCEGRCEYVKTEMEERANEIFRSDERSPMETFHLQRTRTRV